MRRVKNHDTTPELALRCALHAEGLRFRKNSTVIPGRPDLVFKSSRVLVFVDGDFWHGWNFPAWRGKLSEYWRAKIDRNIRRDRRTRRRLSANGWTVIRVWEHDILRDLPACVCRVARTVRSARAGGGVR